MSFRARTLLATSIVVLLVGGVVAWRVVDRDEPEHSGDAGHHQGQGPIEHPDFDVESARAGDWSDPETWSTGTVPAEGDVVHVEHEVKMDEADAHAGQLWLNAPLRFDPSKPATRLTMHGSLVVDEGGLLEIRQPNPVRSAVLAFDVEDEQAMVGGFDFVPEDTGLWVLSGGRTELHGAPVRNTWVDLVGDYRAGDRELFALGDLHDWPQDAEAVVTATDLGKKQTSEVVRVVRMNEKTTLHLKEGLRFDHRRPRQIAGAGPMRGEIGLLTHNVKVESLDPENRAHVFFYGGAGGGISYTQFDRMGPDNQFSRYALHFHVMGDSSRGMEVRGSSFRGSGTFWLNIHGSDGMNIVDNVGYQAKGAGFYMEHPAGIGNTWLHNLGVEVAPSVKLQHRNAVFWFLLGNSLIDNVGVGAYGGADSSGIFIPQQPRDDPALEHPTVILHNEAHSNRQYGFASWMNLSPEFHVVDLLLWRNADAGFHWGAYGTRFEAYNIGAFDNGEYDIEARVKGLHLQDSVLSGAPVGMFFSNPVVNTNPENPSRILRTSFGEHAVNDVSIDTERECKRSTKRCPAMYLQFAESSFSSERPVRFGWQWHPETRLWFQDVRANGLPASFTLIRQDQPKPSPEVEIDPDVGAWIAPGERIVDELPPRMSFVFIAEDGNAGVGLADPASVERIEYLVNGQLVGETRPGTGIRYPLNDVDLPEHAFLTVRVVDRSGSVAYSPTIPLREPGWILQPPRGPSLEIDPRWLSAG